MNNPAKDEPAGEFFRHFEPLPWASDQCPSIPDLVAYARGDEENELTTLHVSSCEHCNKLFQLLKGIDQRRSLHEFLRMAREEALKVAPERPSSVFAFIRAFFANQPRWVYVPLAVVVLTIATWGQWNDKLLSRHRYAQDTSVSFEEDKYRKTVLALTEDLENSKSSIRDRQELQSRVYEINKKLAELQGHLDRTQRAELAELVNQYNDVIGARNKPARRSAPAPPEVIIASNEDSKTVGELYRAIDKAVVASQSDPNSNPGFSTEVREAMVPASAQLDIVAIDDKQIVVQDRLANRPSEQQKVLELGIKSFENKRNIKVSFDSSFASKRPD